MIHTSVSLLSNSKWSDGSQVGKYVRTIRNSVSYVIAGFYLLTDSGTVCRDESNEFIPDLYFPKGDKKSNDNNDTWCLLSTVYYQ